MCLSIRVLVTRGRGGMTRTWHGPLDKELSKAFRSHRANPKARFQFLSHSIHEIVNLFDGKGAILHAKEIRGDVNQKCHLYAWPPRALGQAVRLAAVCIQCSYALFYGIGEDTLSTFV